MPTQCGGEEAAVFCGACLDDEMACVDNKCECPPGVDCDDECGNLCVGEEICVDGQCCVPTYPCAQSECSPPGGLPDGCGGVAHCPPCGSSQECVFGDQQVFECIGDCTCESRDIQCGTATICGSPTLCGTCADNGFEGGYRCESGKCVCEDQFEYNDSFESFALVCSEKVGGVNCMQDAWSIDLQASLHSQYDIDYYALEVLDARTPILAQAYNGSSRRILSLAYLCPDGFSGMVDCSDNTDFVQGIEFCVTDSDTLGIERQCDTSASSVVGTLLVGVTSKEFQGDCDGYGLKIMATYGVEIPD